MNNGIGMSGIDLFAQIVPVRVLGECGGTDEDVFEGMLWASGVQIAGVPPNPFPAKVINMSLGGAGSCPNAVQDAIDDALAQGSVVVVAAGNESSDTSNFAPSGCSGVITVAASNRFGDIAFYSNFGRRVDIAAPGGDFDDGGVLSLSNDGQTVVGNDAYANAIGTSAAAPQVSGVVSMMLARDPTLTAGRVLSILQGTAREFPPGSVCRNGNVCGAGILDAGLAMASTVPGGITPPAGAATVVEYYRVGPRPLLLHGRSRRRSRSSTAIRPPSTGAPASSSSRGSTRPLRRPARSRCASSSAAAPHTSTRTTTRRAPPNARSCPRPGPAPGRSSILRHSG